MIYQCSLDSADDMRQWDAYVISHPDGTPFHLYSWIRTIYDSYHFEPNLYANKDEQGNITSILPLFVIRSLITGSKLISLPFTDFCGPLCRNCDDEKELLEKVITTLGKHFRHIEIRSELMGTDSLLRDNFFKRHVLRLEHDPSSLFKKFDKKTIQYSIKKAQKSGVEIWEENSEEGMEMFFELNRMTRKKHGVPHQPRLFFNNVYKNMFSGGNAFLLLARSDSKILAGGLFFRLNKTIHYKYNASDQEYLNEKRPNHLLTWNAIERACSEQYDYFDFGRTAPCNNGLMRYKEMWGAQPLDAPYYHYPKVKGLSSGKVVGATSIDNLSKIWKKLPDTLVDILSTKIYKHLA